MRRLMDEREREREGVGPQRNNTITSFISPGQMGLVYVLYPTQTLTAQQILVMISRVNTVQRNVHLQHIMSIPSAFISHAWD